MITTAAMGGHTTGPGLANGSSGSTAALEGSAADIGPVRGEDSGLAGTDKMDAKAANGVQKHKSAPKPKKRKLSVSEEPFIL